MRVAGRIAAQALAEVGRHVVPGVTTDELDRIGHEFLVAHGAYPSTLGYRGYPKSLCTSLNEVICHGIPDDTVIADGDIVNIDITAYIDGVHGDTNATFLAGDVDEESRLLVERTHEAMMRGIRAVAPGRPLNVIGRVIESYARRFGYGVVRDFTGHGIGTTFHSGLVVPHFDDPDVEIVDGAGHDVHHRADADPGHDQLRHLAGRLDRGDQGPQAHRPVRAHPAGHGRRRRDPDAAVTGRAAAPRGCRPGRPARRARGDEGAAALPGDDQPPLAQHLHGAAHRLVGDLVLVSQRPLGGQPHRELALGDALGDGVRHLQVAVVAVHLVNLRHPATLGGP